MQNERHFPGMLGGMSCKARGKPKLREQVSRGWQGTKFSAGPKGVGLGALGGGSQPTSLIQRRHEGTTSLPPPDTSRHGGGGGGLVLI